MKRKEKMVPGLDDIIFENRNKEYGAYDLRKRYKSVAGLSIIGGATLSTIILVTAFAARPDKVTAGPDRNIVIVVKPDNYINPEKITPPVETRPQPAATAYKYVAPEVVEDTVDIDNFMTIEAVLDSVENRDVGDTIMIVDDNRPITGETEKPEIFISVEEPPFFPGGTEALLKYIAGHTLYPPEALDNNIEGKVFVKFAVMADGTVDMVEVIRSIHPLLDKEASRVVSELPLWKPGRQNGVPVAVWYSVPVTFTIRFE